MILAIDPGPEQSAYVLMPDRGIPVVGELPGAGSPLVADIVPNSWLRDVIDPKNLLVIESVESFGMPVGREVFETCYWIGRFDPDKTAILIPRREIKLHLCNSARARDPNIREALIDRFGPGKAKAIGLKKSPGPLYGFKSHMWSALALAVTYYDRRSS